MTLEHWKRFVCNLPTRGGKAAITIDEWTAALTTTKIPEDQPIWVGLDVAWKWDTTAAVPYWEKSKQERILGVPVVLVPPRDGNSLDPNEVEAALLKIHARNPIHTVVMDPSKAEQLAEWIRATIGAKVIERKQTNAYAEIDYARFMEALRSGWLKQPGDRTLTQHVLNAIARITPYGAARFDRPASMRDAAGQEQRVIDALSAAAMVHAQANEEAPVDDKPKWRILA
jgi:phage terminase large subunit-like protein